ncbi:hypothetical protein FQZ97_643400 [compost metagenome]
MVGLGHEEARVAEAGREHLALAQRGLHGLAHRRVGGHAFLGVEHEVGEAERRRHDRQRLAAGLLQARQRFHRQQVGKVVLAGECTFDARAGVRHGHEAQLFDGGLTLAAVAARGLLARGVLVEAREQHELVGAALLELVGAGADEVLQRRGHRFLGHHRGGAIAGQSQLRQQRRIRRLQHDLHAQRALGLEALDFLAHGLAARRLVHPALQAGDHVVGRELAPVVQHHALAQRDGVGLAVGRDLRHALGQHRHHVPLGVEGVQRLVHVLHDGSDQVGRGGHRVERLRLGHHRQRGEVARALRMRFMVGQRGAQHREQRSAQQAALGQARQALDNKTGVRHGVFLHGRSVGNEFTFFRPEL